MAKGIEERQTNPQTNQQTNPQSTDPTMQIQREHNEPRNGPAPGEISALGLFLIFSRIGLTSFGGGLSGWFLREFVQDRHWMTEEEFLDGLALSQALPGVNVKNLAIWIGYRLLGWRGAVAGFCGIVFPPAVTIVLLGVFFSAIAYLPLTHIALAGAAAAAIGLSLSMAITAVRRLPRRLFPYLVLVATFAAAALFRVSLVWTVVIAGGLSVGYEYLRSPKQP